MIQAIAAYTTMKNKVHLTYGDMKPKSRTKCGQGKIDFKSFVWSEEHPTDWLQAKKAVYLYLQGQSLNICKNCFQEWN
jgi:hypothetical protein